MEFTVIGDTVNVASRFSGLAKPGQVLLTEDAIKRVEGLVENRELESSKVRGKAEALRVLSSGKPVISNRP